MVARLSKGIALFNRFGFIAFVVAFLAAVINLGLPPTNQQQLAAQRNSLLRRGRWLNNHTLAPTTWQPDGCSLQHYNQAFLHKCMLKPNSNIIFMGDSTARQLFWETAHMLDPKVTADFNIHGNAKYTRTKDNITVHLFWDPYLDRQDSMGMVTQIANGTLLPNGGPATILYVTTGLWHAMFHKPRNKIQPAFERAVDNFVEVIRNAKPGTFEAVYFAPTQLAQYFRLDLWRKVNITKKVVDKMYAYTDKIFDYNYKSDTGSGIIYSNDKHRKPLIYYFPVMNRLGSNKNSLYDRLGLHLAWPVVSVQVDLLYNHFCNTKIQDILPPTTTCGVTYDRTEKERMFIIGWVGLVAIATAFSMRRPSNKSLKLVAWIGVACLYSHLCERTIWIANETSSFVGFIESFLLIQVLVVAIVLSITGSLLPSTANHFAVDDNTKDDILVNTAESIYFAEWKGLLMAGWLLLAYTGLDNYSFYHLRIAKSVIESTLLYIEIHTFAVALTTTAMTTRATILMLARRLLNVTLLPMLLALTLKVDLYQAYRTLPIKFGLWYVVTAVVIRLLYLVFGASSTAHQSNSQLAIKIIKVLGSGAAFLIITGFILSQIWSPSFFDKKEVLKAVRADFFVPLVAINITIWTRMSAEFGGSSAGENKNTLLKKRYLYLALFFIFTIIGNYLTFVNPGSGHGRSTVIHFVTFYFIFFYTVILRPIPKSSVTVRSGHTTAGKLSLSSTLFHYSRFLVYWGPCWVQLLVLSQHILLTKNGHVKVHLIPTSLVNYRMSVISQTFNYVIVFVIYGLVARSITSLMPSPDPVPESVEATLNSDSSDNNNEHTIFVRDNNNDGFDIDDDLDIEAQKRPLTLDVVSSPSTDSCPTTPDSLSHSTDTSLENEQVKQG